MRPLVFNSTPLIYLTKVGLSEVIGRLKIEKLTSSTVKREVVDEGKRRGVPDAFVLEKMFENRVLKVAEPRDQTFLSRLLKTRGIHVAEAEVLVLAKECGGLAVIDDDVARKTAKVYGIAYVGSPYVLMKAVSDGLISKEKARQVLKDMVSVGWRCSVESYARILDALERV